MPELKTSAPPSWPAALCSAAHHTDMKLPAAPGKTIIKQNRQRRHVQRTLAHNRSQQPHRTSPRNDIMERKKKKKNRAQTAITPARLQYLRHIRQHETTKRTTRLMEGSRADRKCPPSRAVPSIPGSNTTAGGGSVLENAVDATGHARDAAGRAGNGGGRLHGRRRHCASATFGTAAPDWTERSGANAMAAGASRTATPALRDKP